MGLKGRSISSSSYRTLIVCLCTFLGNTAANAERLGIGEIRDLINLEMPQLNEALVSNKDNTQVNTTESTCFGLVIQ